MIAGSELGVLKWRYQSRDEHLVPLSINAWPSASFPRCMHTVPSSACHRALSQTSPLTGCSSLPPRPTPSVLLLVVTAGSELGVLKWRYQSRDENLVPLSINAWPSASGKDCYVNIEYESNVDYDLQGVVIVIPLPHLGHAPTVNQVRKLWCRSPLLPPVSHVSPPPPKSPPPPPPNTPPPPITHTHTHHHHHHHHHHHPLRSRTLPQALCAWLPMQVDVDWG